MLDAFADAEAPDSERPTHRHDHLRSRTSQGIAQETLAHLAGIERSHVGKIERGEHTPTLPLILKIARALKCSSAHLMALTEAKLAEPAPSKTED